MFWPASLCSQGQVYNLPAMINLHSLTWIIRNLLRLVFIKQLVSHWKLLYEETLWQWLHFKRLIYEIDSNKLPSWFSRVFCFTSSFLSFIYEFVFDKNFLEYKCIVLDNSPCMDLGKPSPMDKFIMTWSLCCHYYT